MGAYLRRAETLLERNGSLSRSGGAVTGLDGTPVPLTEAGLVAAAHRRGETAGFLADARRSFTPSMRQRIDLPDLYADALYRVQAANTGDARPLPETCPFALEELLDKRPDLAKLGAKLSSG